MSIYNLTRIISSFFILIITSKITNASDKRIALVETTFNQIINLQYFINQLLVFTKSRCLFNCLKEDNCVSFSYSIGPGRCILFSADFRNQESKFEELSTKESKHLNLYSIQNSTGLGCIAATEKFELGNVCSLGAKALKRSWSTWQDWEPIIEQTCAGKMVTGRRRVRTCESNESSISYGVETPCIGESYQLQRKSIATFPLQGDAQKSSSNVCAGKGLQLFSGLHLMCENSTLFSYDMTFWTDFKRIGSQKYRDQSYELVTITDKSHNLWAIFEPNSNFAVKQNCVRVKKRTLRDYKCELSILKVDVNIVVCDMYKDSY